MNDRLSPYLSIGTKYSACACRELPAHFEHKASKKKNTYTRIMNNDWPQRRLILQLLSANNGHVTGSPHTARHGQVVRSVGWRGRWERRGGGHFRFFDRLAPRESGVASDFRFWPWNHTTPLDYPRGGGGGGGRCNSSNSPFPRFVTALVS